ncbi:MAG: hypothetical protein JWM87_3786 [Candidatus Eremiobacteraeota bacterium]|nr:hypothetical protein [Candidatus Eremiobacteraeota bacterium]
MNVVSAIIAAVLVAAALGSVSPAGVFGGGTGAPQPSYVGSGPPGAPASSDSYVGGGPG